MRIMQISEDLWSWSFTHPGFLGRAYGEAPCRLSALWACLNRMEDEGIFPV